MYMLSYGTIRFKIFFAKIKVFNKVYIKKDKLIFSYMSFVYLALIILHGVYVHKENYKYNIKRLFSRI